MKKIIKCVYNIYKYNLLKEVISYVSYKKSQLENKPKFVIEWELDEFKKHTSSPENNQDNPYTEDKHKVNYRLSKIWDLSKCDTTVCTENVCLSTMIKE